MKAFSLDIAALVLGLLMMVCTFIIILEWENIERNWKKITIAFIITTILSVAKLVIDFVRTETLSEIISVISVLLLIFLWSDILSCGRVTKLLRKCVYAIRNFISKLHHKIFKKPLNYNNDLPE